MFWRKRNVRRRSRLGLLPGIGLFIDWLPRLLLLALLVDLFYVTTIWPDWPGYRKGEVPKSNFIKHYEKTRKQKHQPPLHWQPVPISQMPDHLLRAVVVAEDSRFYQHDGFDLIAFKEAMDYNLQAGRAAFGASTISQQTVKNVFLTGRRDPLRKWHELLLTWGMENNLRKRRILEIYLNVAEFGTGIYGVEAASQYYWGKPVSAITVDEAIELAATLPAPTKQNPNSRTKNYLHRLEKIQGWYTPLPPNGD